MRGRRWRGVRGAGLVGGDNWRGSLAEADAAQEKRHRTLEPDRDRRVVGRDDRRDDLARTNAVERGISLGGLERHRGVAGQIQRSGGGGGYRRVLEANPV